MPIDEPGKAARYGSDQFPTVKTLEDFARAAADAAPAHRRALLREAQKLVVDCFSARRFLRLLITHHLGDDALRRRSADRVLTMATAECDINGVRDAAEFARLEGLEGHARAADRRR